MASKKQKEQDQKEAREFLREHIKPGTTVYTTITHVSSSGMSRRIRLFIIGEDRQPFDISGWVAQALGYRRRTTGHDDGAVIVGGCGMDMGFHLVHNLSYALHGHDSVGDDALKASKDGRAFTPRPDAYRGGYSLNHRWL